MEKYELKSAIEAILYVYGEALPVSELAEVVDQPQLFVSEVLREMAEERRAREDGILLNFYGDKVQFSTNPAYSGYVQKLMDPAKRPQSLSRATIETLAVVAYNQPVTKAEVEAVRGVRCDYAVASLLQKGLIYVSGRKDTVGKPLLYSTNEEFLRHFGISTLAELPRVESDE